MLVTNSTNGKQPVASIVQQPAPNKVCHLPLPRSRDASLVDKGVTEEIVLCSELRPSLMNDEVVDTKSFKWVGVT
ncbi:hypothetical protein HJFPF1_03021 [Paramyrothecium foliicola]|nr:hypothetical protein HJFPF1_03021 [Paramyrothecium foliicola]